MHNKPVSDLHSPITHLTFSLPSYTPPEDNFLLMKSTSRGFALFMKRTQKVPGYFEFIHRVTLYGLSHGKGYGEH